MLPWDGSLLDNLTKDDVTSSITSPQGLVYWQFLYRGQIEHCIRRGVSGAIKATHACLIDEMKPLFGVTKTGTHRVKWRGKTYVIFRVVMCSWAPNYIQDEYIVSKIPNLYDFMRDHPEIKAQVQCLMVVWHILGVKSGDTCILLRSITPVGFRELSIDPQEFSNSPRYISKKWFDDRTIRETLRTMLNIICSDDLFHCQVRLRSSMAEIFQRIDPKESYLIAPIIQRLINTAG